jgi:hypothetical protein
LLRLLHRPRQPLSHCRATFKAARPGGMRIDGAAGIGETILSLEIL